jgi:hypothetical protein
MASTRERDEGIGNRTLQEIAAQLKALQDSGRPAQIPLIDPTANVLSLVAAAIERQDDLRDAEFKRLADLMKKEERCAHEVQAVRLRAQRDLAAAESRRIDALTLAESRRIDALLAAASNNVALASEKAAAQAATLAQQVATSAEALRAQVATTATAVSAQLESLRDTFDKRITLLERSGYQMGGRDDQRDKNTQGTYTLIASLVAILGLVASVVFSLIRVGH